MEIKNIFKTFILLLDGVWGMIIILALFIPLWLISSVVRALTRHFVKINTQRIHTGRKAKYASNIYTILKYLRKSKLNMWKAFDYGYDHLLPIEQRRRSPKRK